MKKSPPLLSKTKSYDDWLKLVEVWRQFITLKPEKQGPAVVLTLKEEAQDAILELDTSNRWNSSNRENRQNYHRTEQNLEKGQTNTKVQSIRSI